MPDHVHPHRHAQPPGHSHGHFHGHSHDHTHHHAHEAATPHPPMALPVSFLRMSIGARLGIAALASAALWCAVWLAMRPN